ncbi:MAG: transporter substrate-binding domain-containing protein, partial [Methylophilaceae bacterium]
MAQHAHAAGDLLTAQEREWIAQHPDIRIAISPVYPPISFMDPLGQPIGLANEYLALIQQRLNIQLKPVIPTPVQRAANRPEDKQADVVGIFAETPERHEHWLFTRPYLKFDLYLIARDDAPSPLNLRLLKGGKISVVNHFAAREYLEKQYPNVAIDAVEDTCTGLQHVAFAKSTAILTDLPVASWCLRDQGLINLKIAEKTEFSYEMGIGVRKDWPELQRILEKGLNSITMEEREEMYRRWTAKNVFVDSWLQQNKLWVAALALILLATTLVRLY